MRKRERIKNYLPYLTGGLYFLLLQLIVTKLNIDTEEYLVFLVAIWGFMTVGSVVILEKGIDLFDITMENGLEEDYED